MSEACTYEKPVIDPELRERRLLTESEHLMAAMRPNGRIPQDVLDDVELNLETAVYELAMPLAVSVTSHRVEYIEQKPGVRERVITWLGRNAVEVALAGKLHHKSLAAHRRVDVEVDEARLAQEQLKPKVAQVFISPKMSEQDATAEVAQAEHLYDDDSLRVTYAVTNSKGEVVARRLESLLVRDVPLEAWVSMLKDPNNIFGRAFAMENEMSALTIMELFSQMELPETAVPEGPVTLVAAVLPYIADADKADSVAKQLEGFRGDQVKYKEQAKRTAREWLGFEVELARSLKDRKATYGITRFIAGLQLNWSKANLQVINAHNVDGQGFSMTKQLAAVLEDAKRQTLNTIAGLSIGNEQIINQIAPSEMQDILAIQHQLNVLRASNTDMSMINQLQMDLERKIAQQNVRVKGGCIGSSENNFRGNEDSSDMTDSQKSGSAEKDWKWKLGKCQIKSCSSPNPTKVGPCNICERCQARFDKGEDPAKTSLLVGLLGSMGKAVKNKILARSKGSKPETV